MLMMGLIFSITRYIEPKLTLIIVLMIAILTVMTMVPVVKCR